MPVELRPLGVVCNIACQYCYQNPQRGAGNAKAHYDLEKMKQAVEKENQRFVLFGGEPLLIPEEHLQALWSWGLQKFGSNGIQTNATLMNDRHLDMFRKYKVSVGISCDGPGELNDIRWAGTLAATREATARTQAAIERLCGEGLRPSVIVTLHRGNATAGKLPALLEWLRRLDGLGVRSVRLHILEIDDPEVRARSALTAAENIEAFLFLASAEKDFQALHFDVFADIRNLLLGKDRNATCIWGACDPYTTSAVRGIEGYGQRSNCGRTNKDGIDFVKTDSPGYERYLALYQTPQQAGGCRNCRFFLMCKGQCPGTAIDGDWRNRSQDCEVWKALFEHFEDQLLNEGKVPISIHAQRRRIENWFLRQWAAGRNALMHTFIESNHTQFQI